MGQQLPRQFPTEATERRGPGALAETMKEYRRMTSINIKPAVGTVPLAKLTGARLDNF